MKKITLGQFIDNIEKNGFPQITGTLFSENDDGDLDPKAGACALGQGYWNTFHETVSEDDATNPFFTALRQIKSKDLYGGYETSFTTRVVTLNDELEYEIPQIVEIVRKEYKEFLGTVIYYEST